MSEVNSNVLLALLILCWDTAVLVVAIGKWSIGIFLFMVEITTVNFFSAHNCAESTTVLVHLEVFASGRENSERFEMFRTMWSIGLPLANRIMHVSKL